MRITTTKQLNNALLNKQLKVVKAELHNKSSDKREMISADRFRENFDFLCESGIFMECVSWHYKRNYKTDEYIAECGRMEGGVDNIVIVHLRVNDDVDVEEVEKMLIVEESDGNY